MIELRENRSEIDDRTLLRLIPVSRRQFVGQALKRIFPWAEITIGGHHVAASVRGGDRFVMVVGTGGDWE